MLRTLAHPRDKEQILRRIRTLRADSARRWGRMSAHQMVCHLNDAFLAVIGRRQVTPASGLFQRTFLKWLAIYVPLPWPQGISTRPEVDQEIGGTKPAEFAADVAQLEKLVELITSQNRDFRWHSHPIFGVMSEWAWLRWAYLHMDHHLRQFGV